MSGQLIRAGYRHFHTMCEPTSDNSPTVSNSSFLNLCHPNRAQIPCTISLLFCEPIRINVQHTFVQSPACGHPMTPRCDDDDSASRSVCRPASDPKQSKKRDDTNAIHKSVSEINSGLTDSAFIFRFFFSYFSILASLLRLLFSACFKILLFFLPSSFSVCFLESSSFLLFFLLIFPTSSWILHELTGRNMKHSNALQNSGSKKTHFVCYEKIIFCNKPQLILQCGAQGGR